MGLRLYLIINSFLPLCFILPYSALLIMLYRMMLRIWIYCDAVVWSQKARVGYFWLKIIPSKRTTLSCYEKSFHFPFIVLFILLILFSITDLCFSPLQLVVCRLTHHFIPCVSPDFPPHPHFSLSPSCRLLFSFILTIVFSLCSNRHFSASLLVFSNLFINVFSVKNRRVALRFWLCATGDFP